MPLKAPPMKKRGKKIPAPPPPAAPSLGDKYTSLPTHIYIYFYLSYINTFAYI